MHKHGKRMEQNAMVSWPYLTTKTDYRTCGNSCSSFFRNIDPWKFTTYNKNKYRFYFSCEFTIQIIKDIYLYFFIFSTFQKNRKMGIKIFSQKEQVPKEWDKDQHAPAFLAKIGFFCLKKVVRKKLSNGSTV